MRAKVGSYKQLRVWRQAKVVALATYRATRRFPADERFAMSSQLRRAATSVIANIAEGNGRPSRREYAHHVSIAYGSLLEVEATLDLARDLGYLTDAEFEEVAAAITPAAIMLLALRAKLLANPD